MRRSRKDQLLNFLFFFVGSEGTTVKEIAGERKIVYKIRGRLAKESVVWPRATVFRLFEKLVAENKVIKRRDSANDGCRGRPTFRYLVNGRPLFLWPRSYKKKKEKKKIMKIEGGKVTEEVIEEEVFLRRLTPEQKQFLKEYKQYFKK